MNEAKASAPRGLMAMGVFLAFGALMAFVAGFTLLERGTVLDRMWTLNPRAYRALAPLGKSLGIPFLLLSFALAVASVGWLKRRLWGWWLAVGIVAMQVLGGVTHIFLGRIVQGATGVAIAGALLLYVLRARVRAVFD